MEFVHKETLDSTNAFAKENMTSLADMTFVYCDKQTKGKGRLDRTWVSNNNKNIYLTIVLKPQGAHFPFVNLTQYLCVITCRILKEYGVKPQIKWPNDILVEGKKIAGILAQTSSVGQNINGVALGIGINLNSTKEEISAIDKPATSLSLLINKPIDRDEFLNRLACEFEKDYQEFASCGFRFIEEEYLSQANFINKELTVNTAQERLCGVVKKLTRDGALLLCDNRTQEEVVITMGEIQ